MPQPPLDLLIIGAGPVGLATAVGATHRGAKRILIVDQAQELRPVGNRLNLLPNALEAIDALAPGIRERLQPFFRTADPSKPRMCVLNPKGADIDTRYVKSLATIQWWQLQRLLLDALPDEGIVVLNHQLVDIRHEDGTGVVCAEFVADRQRRNRFKNWDGDDEEFQFCEDADFANGTYECRPEFEMSTADGNGRVDYGPHATLVKCRAKVIVGADGINSVARGCVYRDCGKGWENYTRALYSGITRLGISGDPDLSQLEEQLFQETYRRHSDFLTLTVEQQLITHESLRVLVFEYGKGGRVPFSWFLGFYAPVDEATVRNASQEELQVMIADMVREAGFSEAILAIFDRLVESGAKIIIRPFFIIPANHPPPFETLSRGEDLDYPPDFQRPWYHRRVVLAGDAIHAMPPLLAQGSAMGLEDAFELVTHLAHSGVWSMPAEESPSEELLENIFQRYQAGRLHRVCKLQNLTVNRTSEYDVEVEKRNNAEIEGYDPHAVAKSLGMQSYPW